MTSEDSPSSADKILRRIEAATENHFLPIIGPQKGKYLVEEVQKTKPKRVLEVGTLIGYSAILMGKELPADSEIVTIEIDQDEVDQARENILEASIPAKVIIIKGNALDVIPTRQDSFDFMFIDAEKTEYLFYLHLAEEKLRKGTVVFADNAGLFATQMSDYLNYVRKSGKYSSRYIEIGDDGVEISVKI